MQSSSASPLSLLSPSPLPSSSVWSSSSGAEASATAESESVSIKSSASSSSPAAESSFPPSPTATLEVIKNQVSFVIYLFFYFVIIFLIVSTIPQRSCLSLPQANGSVSKLSEIDHRRNNSLKVRMHLCLLITRLRLHVDMKCVVIKKSYLCNAAVRRLPERFKQRQKHDNTVFHLHQENLMWESISPLRKSGSFAEIMFC